MNLLFLLLSCVVGPQEIEKCRQSQQEWIRQAKPDNVACTERIDGPECHLNVNGQPYLLYCVGSNMVVRVYEVRR